MNIKKTFMFLIICLFSTSGIQQSASAANCKLDDYYGAKETNASCITPKSMDSELVKKYNPRFKFACFYLNRCYATDGQIKEDCDREFKRVLNQICFKEYKWDANCKTAATLYINGISNSQESQLIWNVTQSIRDQKCK